MAYITVSRGTELLGQRYDREGEAPRYASLSTSERTTLLAQASTRMDSFPWKERLASDPQWPREGEVPERIEKAVLELAVYYAEPNRELHVPVFARRRVQDVEEIEANLHPSLRDIPFYIQVLIQEHLVTRTPRSGTTERKATSMFGEGSELPVASSSISTGNTPGVDETARAGVDANKQAIEAEAAARKAADDALGIRIDNIVPSQGGGADATARTAARAAQEAADAAKAAADAAQTTANENRTEIEAEETARRAADGVLERSISSEEAARQAADRALGVRIDGLDIPDLPDAPAAGSEAKEYVLRVPTAGANRWAEASEAGGGGSSSSSGGGAPILTAQNTVRTVADRTLAATDIDKHLLVSAAEAARTLRFPNAALGEIGDNIWIIFIPTVARGGAVSFSIGAGRGDNELTVANESGLLNTLSNGATHELIELGANRADLKDYIGFTLTKVEADRWQVLPGLQYAGGGGSSSSGGSGVDQVARDNAATAQAAADANKKLINERLTEAQVEALINTAFDNGIQIPARAAPRNEINGKQQYFGADFYADDAVGGDVLTAHANGSTFWDSPNDIPAVSQVSPGFIDKNNIPDSFRVSVLTRKGFAPTAKKVRVELLGVSAEVNYDPTIREHNVRLPVNAALSGKIKAHTAAGSASVTPLTTTFRTEANVIVAGTQVINELQVISGAAGGGGSAASELSTKQKIALLTLIPDPGGITYQASADLSKKVKTIRVRIPNPELLTGDVWVAGEIQGQPGLARTKWTTATASLTITLSNDNATAVANALISNEDEDVLATLRFYDASSSGNEIERLEVNIPLVKLSASSGGIVADTTGGFPTAITKIWTGTPTQYSAIAAPREDTLYFIT